MKTIESLFNASLILDKQITIPQSGRYRISLQKVFLCEADLCESMSHYVSVKSKYSNSDEYNEIVGSYHDSVLLDDFQWNELSNTVDLAEGTLNVSTVIKI